MIIFNSGSVLWNPSGDGSQVVSVSEQHLELWDLDRSASTAEVSLYCMHCTRHDDALKQDSGSANESQMTFSGKNMLRKFSREKLT